MREQTAAYTSYDASYRSGHLRVTGVLNVPTGRGPFPAVVLAHGYIDPAYYVSGQGMTRERGYLATQGFVAFHVDYRNHAGSDDDPLAARRLRTGYALDVVNAVQALRRTPQVPVDDDRIGLFGRSMGGGVVYKALEIAPGLVGAATAWASVSSREDENFDHFIREDGDRDPLVDFVEQEYGLPGQAGSAKFWREISARTYFDRITEPVLLVHGSSDSTCPPAWARASYRALRDGRRRRAPGVVPGRARLRAVVLRGDGADDGVLPERAGLSQLGDGVLAATVPTPGTTSVTDVPGQLAMVMAALEAATQ